MTDKAVSALTSLTGANTATGDLLYIVDISEAAAADRSKKITAEELQNYLKKFPATIAVGNATPSASGGGVSFPATASASSDANTLDDYEEGVWSPTITATSGTLTSATSTDGVYTKIGNVVHARVFVSITNAGTGSGSLRLTLPITASSVFFSGSAAETAITGFACAVIGTGSTTLDIRKYDWTTVIATGAGFNISVTYHA